MTTSNRLPVLAEAIKRAHTASRSALKQSLDKAIEAGEALIEAKSLVAHGEWLPWLKEHCGLSERTAQRYMRLAKHKDTVLANPTQVSDLTIRDALALLDSRTDLERAYALEAEQEALQREVRRLGESLDTASMIELRYIIDRAEEIIGRNFEIRMTATREIGRLIQELNSTTGELRRELADDDPWPNLDGMEWTFKMVEGLAA